MVTLSKAEHLLPFLEQPIPDNHRWVLRKYHCIETLWCVPCLSTDGCPNRSCSVLSQDVVGSFFFFSFFNWVTVRGEVWMTPRDMSTSSLPRVSERSGVTGFIPADPSFLPRMPFKRNKKRVLWGVKSWLVLCPKRTFFTNNYHIIINTQERHDVKMKLLKTFLDQHLALYKLTDNPIRHSSRLWVWAKLENCCHYIVIINTL